MRKKRRKASLIGSWKLVSFRVRRLRKGLIDWADNVSGLLIYSADGTMSVAINSHDTKKDSLNHLLFYSGRFKVAKNTVKHFVENATLRSRIGQTMNRKYSLEGNTLTIESLPPSNHSILVWRRLK